IDDVAPAIPAAPAAPVVAAVAAAVAGRRAGPAVQVLAYDKSRGDALGVGRFRVHPGGAVAGLDALAEVAVVEEGTPAAAGADLNLRQAEAGGVPALVDAAMLGVVPVRLAVAS